MEQINTTINMKIDSEVEFYGIDECCKMLKWSEATVQKMFNDPAFPSSDFGKRKVVLKHAFIQYFMVRHEREKEKFWKY